jgi:uncharacterized Zn finger protein
VIDFPTSVKPEPRGVSCSVLKIPGEREGDVMRIAELSDAALLSYTDPEVLARGQNYARSGAVTQIVQRESLLSAKVEGSEYEPYQVEIQFDSGGGARATCTCPYDWGGWCKHIVAVLLTCRAAPGQVEERPSLEALLRPLDRDQLHELLLALAQHIPSVTERIEHELLTRQAPAETAQTTRSTPPQRRTAVDTRNYRRQAEAIVGAVHGMRSSMDVYYYTGAAVSEMNGLITQARTFTENGDGHNALRILEAITEPYVNHWFEMDDSDGEAGNLFEELGEVWAEAILTADLSPEEREDWEGTLEHWQSEVEEYGIDIGFVPAITAARQGWDDPLIVAMLQGETSKLEEEDRSSPPFFSSTRILTEARLNVLERQGRMEEFLNLARAMNALPRYATMLVRTGRTKEALETGLMLLTSAENMLALATTLHNHGELEAALHAAEHGLTLAGPRDRLAVWLRDMARQHGRPGLALRAAEVACCAAPSLQTYFAVQDLAGEQWGEVRTELLGHLRTKAGGFSDRRLDIFLHEGLIDDAIAIVERGYTYGILDRVLEAAVEQRPDWVIRMGKRHIEPIINEGKSKYYDEAVRRLALVRRAYRHAGRAGEWQRYEAELRTTHGRKHKFMNLLKQILSQ